MFITILMLTFALSLFFVPESQAYVVRTWTFVATLIPMCFQYCHRYRNTLVVVGWCICYIAYCCSDFCVVLADHLDTDTYMARYCKPENHGIDLDYPVAGRWVHWSDWAHLITADAMSYILSMGKVGTSIMLPDNPITGAITGLMLSDGGVQAPSAKFDANFRLHLQVSLKSAAYLAVTACFLEHTGLGRGFIRTHANKHKVTLITKSYNGGVWSDVRAMFYPNGTKIIPAGLPNYLTPFGLALLIMGDGRARNYAMDLCVNNFTKQEVQYLASTLHDLYGVTTNVHGTKSFTVFITANSMPVVRKLTMHYMHPSWHYKVVGVNHRKRK